VREVPGTRPRPGRAQLERRGDLSGFAFVAFGAAMLVALGGVAMLFLSLPPTDGPGGLASPSRVAAASTPPASPSGSPSATATGGPSASAVSPSAAATRRPPPVTSDVGQPATVTIGGVQVGTVTVVRAARQESVGGREAPRRREWLAVEVVYRATEGELPYSSVGWTARDNKRAFRPTTVAIDAALGTGRLVPGESRTGFVIFAVRRKQIERLELIGPEGVPVAAFSGVE
jgi:hypothetical protein